MVKRQANDKIDEFMPTKKIVNESGSRSLERELYGASPGRGENASDRNRSVEKNQLNLQEIESQRPRNEQERVALNKAILTKYAARYTTTVSFAGLDKDGHTHWKIHTTVNDGSKTKPYRNELILETGTFVGCNNYRDTDKEHTVEGTTALHFSEVLYAQIETSREQIRTQASEIEILKDRSIPEFDLKTYVGKEIFHPQTNEVVDKALGAETSRKYNASTPDFARFATFGTIQSKLRLANYYNKDCNKLEFFKGDLFPAIRHTFSNRDSLPSQ